jgi:hypothetical protein
MLVATATVSAMSLSSLPSAGAQTATLEVIARKLANPRGIALGENGAIFVAESGAGGANCQRIPDWGRTCFGITASITRVALDGTTKTLVKLPSTIGPPLGLGFGASDVVVEDGTLFFTMDGNPPNLADFFGPKAKLFNDLSKAKPLERLAELGVFEAKRNPDEDVVESNPYSLARVEGGTLVADAAGNSLIYVPDGGRPKVVATFPTKELEAPDGTMIDAHAVPNTVTVGPDGAYYVGELTGFPFTPEVSRVWRIEPDARKVACDAAATTGECTLYADGLTAIIDIAFGPDGKLYVLEMAKDGLGAVLGAEEPAPEALTGALLRMDGPDTFTEIVSEGLVMPAGLAISAEARMFVTNYGIFPAKGQVVEVIPA